MAEMKVMNGHKAPTMLEEVINDFRKTPKHIHGKYLYDATGDDLFQQLMKHPDYYLANCEAEILSTQTKEVTEALLNGTSTIDLIDMGAGDATKTGYLLKYLVNQGVDMTYYPIDVSSAVIENLEKNLPEQIPGLKIKGLHGEFLEMLEEINRISTNRKVILFLGSTIGCFTTEERTTFLGDMERCLKPKDTVLVGFDLVKHPSQLNAAYNTPISIKFNLNYLDRFNKELGVNFDMDQYEHYSIFDPGAKAQRNFIVSRKDQVISIGGEEFTLAKHEYIHTSLSQKFDEREAEEFGNKAGCKTNKNFYDSQHWFFDVVWEKI